MPTIAIQVLDLAGSDNADIAEIARIISRDPALSGKILRTVNSSFYGRGQHISTISHALVILGLQSVKTLVLGFSLVSNLAKSQKKGFNHMAYWRRSIYAATAARIIAGKINLVQQEQVFLAALLQDIGMLVLSQVLASQYNEICDKAATHADLIKAEQQALGMTHAEVGGIVVEQWKLPPVLAVPVVHSHDAAGIPDAAMRGLAELTQLSGWCADVFIDEHAANAIVQVRSFCKAHYQMSDAVCDTLLEEIGSKTREVASLFEINIGAAANYEAILKKANESLVELTLQTQRQATQLKQRNQVLTKRATIDGLTTLYNRGSFDQFLAEQFNRSIATGKPLTLLMLDLDEFKKVNDRFGHQAGDQVLRTMGKLLRAAVRPQQMAARYGGEELVLLLPGVTRAAGSVSAETIRRAVAARPFRCEPNSIAVTVSVGVATLEPGAPFHSADHLVKAADLAVYAAKHSGRNCVKVFANKAAA